MQRLSTFVSYIEEQYGDNAYHNRKHAADVRDLSGIQPAPVGAFTPPALLQPWCFISGCKAAGYRCDCRLPLRLQATAATADG